MSDACQTCGRLLAFESWEERPLPGSAFLASRHRAATCPGCGQRHVHIVHVRPPQIESISVSFTLSVREAKPHVLHIAPSGEGRIADSSIFPDGARFYLSPCVVLLMWDDEGRMLL